MQNLVAILADANDTLLPDGAKSVRHGRFTAILGKQRRFSRLKRKAALKDAVLRQETLENLMSIGTVLPVLQGMAIRTEDVAAFFDSHADELSTIADRLDGKVQFQIRIGCDIEAAAAWFSRPHGAFVARGEPGEITARFADHAYRTLTAHCLDACRLPIADDLILNCAVLLDIGDVSVFETALQTIDDAWSDGLRIKQIGPSPAVSFGSIGLRQIGRTAIIGARTLLSIDSAASEADVRSARNMALREGKPPEDVRRAAKIVLAAVAANRPNGPLHEMFTWSEGQSETAVRAQLRGAA